MSNERDYSDVNSSLIAREEAKFERLKAKAEAAEENMKESIAALLKQTQVKKIIAADALETMQDEDRINKLKRGNLWAGKDHEVPTGFADGSTVVVESYVTVE